MTSIKYKHSIPKEVSHVTDVLTKAGFSAYLVGGCVRDLVLGREPKDWDITTNAKPEEIIKLFEKTVYENSFGTVAVCVPVNSVGEEDVLVARETNGLKAEKQEDDVSRDTNKEDKYFIIEVTPYRLEAKYTDFRHPDEISFSENLEDDLKRRDFTVNAMVMDTNGDIKDIFGGLTDIKDRVLRTVGNADERFTEDALRMLRVVRFAVELDFTVSHETSESIFKNSNLIKNISSERIRDEFVKIIMSKNPALGIVMLQKFHLLQYIIPELLEGVDCEQGGAHIYDVWNHLLQALQHAADKNWSLEIRLAALFHDIGKPKTRRLSEGSLAKNSRAFALGDKKTGDPRRLEFSSKDNKKKYTFYGHEVVGARMAKKIMERLKFPKKETELVEKFVRQHMFFSDTEQITLSAVRRIITKVGTENIWDLMKVRECDRVGMNKKEAPYRLRKYHAMIEEALHDPISVSALKVDGNFLIKNLGIKPGPRMGWMLHALLEEVLDDPAKNTEEHLSELVKSLDVLGDAELRALGERGKEKKEELEEEELEKLHQKHGVKK